MSNITRQPTRRSDTRQRIKKVALDLFAEQGYEKTSLREIAERLDLTKAALYYHFKTKEAIVVSIADDVARPIDETIAWAGGQPPTLETKKEVLRRYSDALARGHRFFRFMHENQAAVRELSVGEEFKERMRTLVGLIAGDDASLTDQIRCFSALFTLNAGLLAMWRIEGTPEEKRQAALEVATGLVMDAHRAAT